jgi:tRNA nucleotidyltransferase (CCA-adding enzyme)
MNIIMTHEQADFDALGALLGAALMDPQAIPVLPRKLNRNVRAFYNLYQAELPFVHASELSKENIEHVTLVDTQSLLTFKGMTRKTKIHIIDHHQRREGLPEDWELKVYPTGACTTLFVEALKEKNGKLGLVHATLMLLGIYEDTGSLSYVGTTARDAHAAAYLLDCGASLRIANKYLDPPLSLDQRRVYDRLLKSAKSINVQGLHIIITSGSAEDMTEEISSIAHKIRDLIEPDALFLVVTTSAGIRLIARSTTDLINVAEIMNEFGGGGHERAAAALVKKETSEANLEMVNTKLVDLLHSMVKAPLTIAEIMSRGPLLLSPDTTVQKAEKLMQRYGYEGFPVVENGKVIGLLNRRAVDKALAHKLDLTVGSLMEAGNIFVKENQTLTDIQAIMMDTGWGQIPVVSENEEVIGIVTRTDVIKTLSRDENLIPGRENLSHRLETALPPARLSLFKLISKVARDNKLAAYVVGGFVRDLILDRPSFDFDIVVEGDAIALATQLVKQYGGRITSHNRFGTAKWWLNDHRTDIAKKLNAQEKLNPEDLPEFLDLISARTEFYNYPTALPTVERSSIKLDLHRRDFSINTMAIRLDGHHYGDIYDYWGGLADLRKGLIRVLHSLSFVDDPTRMLRAVRFEQRFGFNIEARTLELMQEAYPLIKRVSGQRLQHEFDLILAEKYPEKMLKRLDELQMLKAIHPDLPWNETLQDDFEMARFSQPPVTWDLPPMFDQYPYSQAMGYFIWLGKLPEDKIEKVAKHLRFSNNLKKALLKTSNLWNIVAQIPLMKPSQIIANLQNAPIIVLYTVDLLADKPEIHHRFSLYLTKWQHIKQHSDGETLRAKGITPGPIYNTILSQLRAAWLDEEITSIEEENDLLVNIINAYSRMEKNETDQEA